MLTIGDIDRETRKVRNFKDAFEQAVTTLKLENELDKETERELRIEFQEKLTTFRKTRSTVPLNPIECSINELQEKTKEIQDFVSGIIDINSLE
ncbi:MAG: hypothetical protein JXA43_00085 [Candidatus Diapherotrites archaeon]|nr:hypothetical protein [Candidatus Diapherotrites archaeon]